MTDAQRKLLEHVRDYHDGRLDGRIESEMQTGLSGAAYDAVTVSVVRRNWMTREGVLTDAGRTALAVNT